jgi:hypothetical protein
MYALRLTRWVSETGNRSRCMQHCIVTANKSQDIVTQLHHRSGKEGTGDRNGPVFRVLSVETACERIRQ